MKNNMEVGSLLEALQLAEALKRSGRFDWFRGQTRDWRPLRTSLARLDDEGLKAAQSRLQRFFDWTSSVPNLQTAASDPDAVFAIAQHYGIPTNYMDFTTEPRVAAFFAAYKPPTLNDAFSCIICVNTEQLASFWRGIATRRPDWPEPRRVVLDIPELWRLQAQRGTFLFLPYADFERIYNFDRIVFPAAHVAQSLILEEDIYPPQKSDLEVLLDQYFMLELLADGMKRLPRDVSVIQVEGLADGIERGCFEGNGLPELDSWSEMRLRDWNVPVPERWTAYSGAPSIGLDLADSGDPRGAMSRLATACVAELSRRPQLRRAPVRWLAGGNQMVEVSLRLFWDGVRRWPYTDLDVAHGLALTATFAHLISENPQARGGDSNLAEHLASRCLGSITEVEIGMLDSSYTRGFSNRDDLWSAVRTDFRDHLKPSVRDQITEPEGIFQIVTLPRCIFEFQALSQLFVRQIVPTQVVLRGEASGKARLYNLARAVSIGNP